LSFVQISYKDNNNSEETSIDVFFEREALGRRVVSGCDLFFLMSGLADGQVVIDSLSNPAQLAIWITYAPIIGRTVMTSRAENIDLTYSA